MADVAKLRTEAFLMLSSCVDLEAISYKDVRKYLESKLEVYFFVVIRLTCVICGLFL